LSPPLEPESRFDARVSLDAPHTHDAFISYSRKNRDFAQRLEKALEDYTPPKDLGVPHRHLEIFRDEADFTGVEYHDSVESHLKRSAKLIVICSPDARKSSYVADEIRRFARVNGPANIIPVLLEGVPNNEAQPGNEGSLAFPDALCDVLKMPLATSFRGFGTRGDRIDRGAYEGPWYSLLANLYGLPRSVVEQREKRRQMRRRRTWVVAVATLMAVLLVLLVVTFLSRQEAVRERALAEARGQTNRSLLYVANLNLAHRAFGEGDSYRGYELLRMHLPVPGDAPAADLRSFFWYFLWRLNVQDLEPFQIPDGGSTTAIACSPDGQTLAVGGSGRIVTLWSVADRRLRAALPEQEAAITYLAFAPDGRVLATGSADGRLKLWDSESRQELAPLDRQRGGIFLVLFSPDGQHLVTASAGGDVRVWDVPGRKQIAILTGHDAWGRVAAAAFSPDGLRLTTGGWDGVVKLWSTSNYREPPLTLLKHAEPIRALAFSRGGRFLASGSEDDTIKLWDVDSGKERQTLTGHPDNVTTLTFLPESDILATVSREPSLIVKLWQKQDGVAYREIGHFAARTRAIASTAFLPDTATLATGEFEHTVRLWDLWRRPELGALRGHRGPVWSVSFSADGQTLATGSGDGTAKIWDLGTRRERSTFSLRGTSTVPSVALSPDGTLLLAGSDEGPAVLWRVATSLQIATLGDPGDASSPVAFSPDGKSLATANADGTVRLWDPQTCRQLHQFKTHQGRVRSVAYSFDGQTLATGGDDRTVRLWDVSTRRIIATLEGHTNVVTWVSLSLDGTQVATASSDRTVRLWNVRTGKLLGLFRGHQDSVMSVVFSPDGATLATGANDGMVMLWDLRTLQELAKLPGRAGVNALQFSPDGTVLALGYGDNTVGIWYSASSTDPPRH